MDQATVLSSPCSINMGETADTIDVDIEMSEVHLVDNEVEFKEPEAGQSGFHSIAGDLPNLATSSQVDREGPPDLGLQLGLRAQLAKPVEPPNEDPTTPKTVSRQLFTPEMKVS